MTDLSARTARRAVNESSDGEIGFLISLTVFPAAFDLAAAAAVSSRDVEEVRASVARLIGKKFLRTVRATVETRLWALNTALRDRLLEMPNTREAVSRARAAHEEYFLRALRGVNTRTKLSSFTDAVYLAYMRSNLELAASRRISQLVGAGETTEPPSELTRRQWEVAKLVAAGLTNYQIAHKLGIAEWTAVNHVRSVMRRLRCGSRVEVTRVVLASHPSLAMDPALDLNHS